jgi:hypothetical protein
LPSSIPKTAHVKFQATSGSLSTTLWWYYRGHNQVVVMVRCLYHRVLLSTTSPWHFPFMSCVLADVRLSRCSTPLQSPPTLYPSFEKTSYDFGFEWINSMMWKRQVHEPYTIVKGIKHVNIIHKSILKHDMNIECRMYRQRCVQWRT